MYRNKTQNFQSTNIKLKMSTKNAGEDSPNSSIRTRNKKNKQTINGYKKPISHVLG